MKYREQKNAAWIGGAMDIQEEQGNIVVSSNTYIFCKQDFWTIVLHEVKYVSRFTVRTI